MANDQKSTTGSKTVAKKNVSKSNIKETPKTTAPKTSKKNVNESKTSSNVKPVEQKSVNKSETKKISIKKLKRPKIKKIKKPKVKKIKQPRVKSKSLIYFNQKMKQISPMWSLITFSSLLMSISIERNILLNITNNSMADKVFTFLFFFIGFGSLIFTLTGIFGNLKSAKEVIKNPNESWPLALNFASTALVGSIIIARWSNSINDFQWYFGSIFWWIGYVGVISFLAYWVFTAFFSFNIKEVKGTWLVPPSLLAICFINSNLFIDEFRLFAEINWIIAFILVIGLLILVIYRYIYVNHEKGDKFNSIGFISLAPSSLLISEMYIYNNSSFASHPILPFIIFGFAISGLFLSYMSFVKSLITKRQDQKIIYYSVIILLSSIALKAFALTLIKWNIGNTLSNELKVFWNVNLGIGAFLYGVAIAWIFTITIHLFLYKGTDQRETKNKIIRYLLNV